MGYVTPRRLGLFKTLQDQHNLKITGTPDAGKTLQKEIDDLEALMPTKQNNLSTAQMAACNSGITATYKQSYDSHLANTTIHITAAERTKWNAKQDALTSNSQIPFMTSLAAGTAISYFKTAANGWYKWSGTISGVNGNWIIQKMDTLYMANCITDPRVCLCSNDTSTWYSPYAYWHG